jgi:hypothetical protein
MIRIAGKKQIASGKIHLDRCLLGQLLGGVPLACPRIDRERLMVWPMDTPIDSLWAMARERPYGRRVRTFGETPQSSGRSGRPGSRSA